MQSTAYCYKLSLGWQKGISDFWVAFPAVLGSISLMEQRHLCEESYDTVFITLVEPTLTNTRVCAHLLTGQN